MKVNNRDAVILGNGDYPVHPIPGAALITAPYVVCCDGAANEYIRRGFIPDAIVGDGDSLSAANRAKFSAIFHPSDDQNTNDQTKAIHFLLNRGMTRIALVGATGKREDHTLGNIALLTDYIKAGAEVTMLTDHGMFIPCCGLTTLSSYAGQQISIFNCHASGFKGEGLVWPLSDFTHGWQGTLNEATGNEITIDAQGDYLVYLNY